MVVKEPSNAATDKSLFMILLLAIDLADVDARIFDQFFDNRIV